MDRGSAIPQSLHHAGAVLWAGGARIDPGAHKLAEELLRARCRLSAFAWPPAPGDEVIMREVLVEKFKASTAVSLWVFELLANFAYAFSLPRHFNRCDIPAGIARDTAVVSSLHEGVVAIGVARLTNARCAKYGRHMLVSIIALGRPITRGMTIYAPRTGKYFCDLGKQRTGTRVPVAHTRERRWRLQCGVGWHWGSPGATTTTMSATIPIT